MSRPLAALLLAFLTVMPAWGRPAVWMFPQPFENGASLRSLFAEPDAWAMTRTRIDGLGYADHWLASQFTDAELRAWLPQIARWHLKFGLEVGAIKAWGLTGDRSFAVDRKQWDRFIADGARIDNVAMDEPFSYARQHVDQPREYAIEQVSRFVALVRKNYPGMEVGDIVAYPGIPIGELMAYLDGVQARLRQQNIRGVDFVRVDVDWMHFRPGDPIGQEAWEGLREEQAECERRGVKFSLIYWAANFPVMQRRGLANAETWEQGILHEGAGFQSTGAIPDQMVIESWLDTPDRAVPETEPGTFTNSVLNFTSRFAPGYGTGR